MNIPNTATEFLSALDDAVLTWHHRRFPEFVEAFDIIMDDEVIAWHISDGSHDSHFVTRAILQAMGGLDVERSLAWMEERLGIDDVGVGTCIIETWQEAEGPDALPAFERDVAKWKARNR